MKRTVAQVTPVGGDRRYGLLIVVLRSRLIDSFRGLAASPRCEQGVYI